MSTRGRNLSADEAALWARVAHTVAPMRGRALPAWAPLAREDAAALGQPAAPRPRAKSSASLQPAAPPPPAPREERRQYPPDRHGLDAGWDRRLAKGLVPPDFTLDLHGATLDAAYARLEHGLALALGQGARLVLLITGRPRPAGDHADRGQQRGAIRRKFMDWLAGGPHASRIAAVRAAHPRHGGAGAVYIILKRPR